MILRITVGLLLILALHGCAGRGPAIPPLSPGISLNEICGRYNVSWQWDGVTQVVILEYKGNKAKALVGSKVVLFGKEKVDLSAPLRRMDSTIYVPDDFESKVLAPFGVVSGAGGINMDWSRLGIRTVVIDPGHGGRDPGAVSFGTKEKVVVLDISRRIKDLLERAGIKVIMTRDKDESLTLPQRTEIAARSDADLFLSVHANSNPARKIRGMEVYYVKTKRKNDLDEDQRDKNEKIFTRSRNMRYAPVVSGIVADMMYAHKTAESCRLAQSLVRDCSAAVETPNRGARASRFFVVRNTLMPAVLFEVGYLSNRREEKKLRSPVYRQALAESIAHSILKYAADS